MHRLVIGLTSLLAAIGAVVVGYFFLFGPATDRAADLVPKGAVAYASVYLTPSTGQQMKLAALLGKLPGFTQDQASIGTKLDELTQRFAGDAGLDYRTDLRPWLGDEVAIALMSVPPTTSQVTSATSDVLIVAAVKDQSAADAGLKRLITRSGGQVSTSDYQGVTISSVTGSDTQGGAYAFVNQMVAIGPTKALVQRAIDAAQGRTDSLADSAAFRDAMQSIPSERLAGVYLDLAALATSSGQSSGLAGFSTMGLAVVANENGVQLIGHAPVDPGANASARAALELAKEPGSLTSWMPPTTEAELVLFGAQQTFDGVVSQLGSVSGGQSAQQTIAQLRALAALGLGIDLDKDLLPLFDHEAAVGIEGIAGGTPHGELLLRPSDGTAATAALNRMVEALKSRGAQTTESQAGGTTVTAITIPQIGSLAYANKDGVIVLALTADDVSAAVQAHDSGQTLAASSVYQQAFALAGGRAGNELYANVAKLVDALGLSTSLPSDARDMLTHLDGFALAVPSHDNAIEIHATLTVH
jgi:ABC-type cobalt transport system substrate-binding protein